MSSKPPNTRVQRTRSSASALRSPLMRCPLGGTKGMHWHLPVMWLAVGVAAGCGKSPPLTDWRYTRWGMSEEQVIAASGGMAVAATPQDQPADRSRDAEVKLKAPVEWEGQPCIAFYGFDRGSHKLSSVTLQLLDTSDAAASKLRARLIAAYGTTLNSVKRPDTELLTWFVGDEMFSFVRLVDPAMAVGAPVTSVGYLPHKGES
jgi:hypothetical protein